VRISILVEGMPEAFGTMMDVVVSLGDVVVRAV
jgi:hypothetical protein